MSELVCRARYRVAKITSLPTAHPHVTSFAVYAYSLEGIPLLMSFETISEWRASLLQRAMESEQPVWITWYRSRYGKDIRDVELIES